MAVAFTGVGAVVQRASVVAGNTVGNVSPAWPAAPSTLIGQFALIPIEIRSLVTLPSPPTGWTATTPAANTAGQGYWLWKVIDGTEADPLPISTNLPNRGVALAAIHVFSGVDPVTPIEDYQATASDVSPALGNTTTSTQAGSAHVASWMRQGGTGGTTWLPALAGWTETMDFTTGSGDDAGLHGRYQLAGPTALTDLDVATGTIPNWVKVSGVLRPAATATVWVVSAGTFAPVAAASDISVMLGGAWDAAQEVHVYTSGAWMQRL